MEDTNTGEAKKLRPVIFENAPKIENRPNVMKQRLVLQAMETTQDLKKITELAGLRSVAETSRVIDVMSGQKEFQKSLKTNGLTFDYLTGKLKSTIDNAIKDSDRIKAIQVVMQSMGVDKFETNPNDVQNWQDLLIKQVERQQNMIEGELVKDDIEMYEVKTPPVPEFLRNKDASIEGYSGHDEVDDTLKKIYE